MKDRPQRYETDRAILVALRGQLYVEQGNKRDLPLNDEEWALLNMVPQALRSAGLAVVRREDSEPL
jgi:hypothetical protein